MRRAGLLLALLVAGLASGQATLTYQGQLPTGVAGASTPAVDLCYGNSITYGLTFDALPYPARLEAITHHKCLNFGKGGDTAAGAYARWQDHGKNLPGIEWLYIEICTNDFTAGATGTSCWDTVQTWIEEAVAAGQRVAVWTVLPRGGWGGHTEGIEAARTAFNNALRAYVLAHPEVKLIDAELFMKEPASSPPRLKDAYNWGDGIHVNGDGYEEMAIQAAAIR